MYKQNESRENNARCDATNAWDREWTRCVIMVCKVNACACVQLELCTGALKCKSQMIKRKNHET